MNFKLDLVKRNVSNLPSEEQMELMRRICEVCNTNSFEVVISRNEDCTTSLRGVYPIGAFQNHCCVPNTRHHFDDHQRLYVSASLPIAAGEELTMSYTDLLWDTSSRRQFLRVTKRFSCNCSRCSDPSVCLYTKLKKKKQLVAIRKTYAGRFFFFPRNSDLISERFSVQRTIVLDICYHAILSILNLPGSVTSARSA